MEWPAHLPIVGGGGVTYIMYTEGDQKAYKKRA